MQVIIADDHSIVRRGLKEIIQEAFSDALIDEAEDAETLLKKIQQKKYDVVITDLAMPGRNGLDMIEQIHEFYPLLPILVLSIYPEETYAIRALKNGASGYLNKETAPDNLVQAIRLILNGKKYITPVVAQKLADLMNHSKIKHTITTLSDRELEVFKMLANGISISQIAHQLHLSATTISTYRSRILQKLSLSTNADITRFAIEEKLI